MVTRNYLDPANDLHVIVKCDVLSKWSMQVDRDGGDDDVVVIATLMCVGLEVIGTSD